MNRKYRQRTYWIKRISKVTTKISLISLLLGASIGVLLWWLIVALAYPTQNKHSEIWEFALGVVLGGIVGWTIPVSIDTARIAWRTSHPLRRVLGASCNNKDSTIIFLASLYPKDLHSFVKSVYMKPKETVDIVPKHGIPWVLVESDARALGYMIAILASAGKTDQIKVIRDDIGLEITDANLICIGGSKSNYKTKQINDAFSNIPLKFKLDGNEHMIVSSKSEHIWKADDIYDYAILAKIPNEYDRSKVVFIIGGISYPGTAGAAYYLWKMWSKIASEIEQDFFAFVLKVKRDNFQYVTLEYRVNFTN